MKKTKIIIDADIIIHFAKGGYLNILPQIFSEYDYVILSTVYKEILSPTKIQLDNQISYFKNISIIEFKPTGDMMVEYSKLLQKFGKGESASMAYCKYNNDVLGSSNLRDIKHYCVENSITYLTTLDFIYYAIIRGIISACDAQNFIKEVISKGSNLPNIDITTYVSKTII